jgi:hypothetical protein
MAAVSVLEAPRSITIVGSPERKRKVRVFFGRLQKLRVWAQRKLERPFFWQTDLKWIQKLLYISALLDSSYFEGRREIATEIFYDPLLTGLIGLQIKFTYIDC